MLNKNTHERGWFFDHQLNESIKWKSLPWWKRTWLKLTGNDFYQQMEKTSKLL